MNFPFIWYKNVGETFVRFLAMHAYDGQTDRQTTFTTDSHEDHACIQCSTVKKLTPAVMRISKFQPNKISENDLKCRLKFRFVIKAFNTGNSVSYF